MIFLNKIKNKYLKKTKIMRTIQKLGSLLLISALLLNSCKKDIAKDITETRQQKLEKAMLQAGLKPIANKDIPIGIKPIELSDAQVDSIINGLVPKNDNISAFSKSRPILATLPMANNRVNNTIMDDEGGDVPWGTVNFLGSKQIYFFVNVTIGVNLTFNKIKSLGGFKYTTANTVVTATTYDSAGSLTYSGVSDPVASYTDGTADFKGKITLYYSHGGGSWEGARTVSAHGTNTLTVTVE
jgi:hypothetical protein